MDTLSKLPEKRIQAVISQVLIDHDFPYHIRQFLTNLIDRPGIADDIFAERILRLCHQYATRERSRDRIADAAFQRLAACMGVIYDPEKLKQI